MRRRHLRLHLGLHLGLPLLSAILVSPSRSALDDLDGARRQHQQQPHEQQQQHGHSQSEQEEKIDLLAYVESHLSRIGDVVDEQLFLTQTYEPSKIYKFRDLLAALPVVSGDGIAGSRFYLGDEGSVAGWEYGLVNLAAFLAQCMKETITYDACDENNWDLYDGRYPLANACGQLGQSYQDYACPPGEEHMACRPDPTMRIAATTHAGWYGAPPPLFCAPRTELPWTGYWDYAHWCDDPWADPPEECDAYEGQRSGRFDNEEPVASRAGRTDVEG